MTISLERGIVDAFAANATLNGLLAGRVFPLVLPDTSRLFPSVVYQVIDAPRDYNQEGDGRTVLARVQLRLYAETYQGVVDLRNAFVDAYSGTKPAAFGSPAVHLHGWFVENESDDFAAALQESGIRLFSKRIDVTIHARDEGA